MSGKGVPTELCEQDGGLHLSPSVIIKYTFVSLSQAPKNLDIL